MAFRKIQRKMASGGVSGKEDGIRIQVQFTRMGNEISDGGGAVADLIRDIALAVVQAILNENDVVTGPVACLKNVELSP